MSKRRLVTESFGTKHVYTSVLVVTEHDADDADIRDAIRAAASKAVRRFTPPEYVAGEGQLTLPGL